MLFKPPQTPLGRETPGDSSLSCLLRQEPPSGKSLDFPLRSRPGLWEDCEGESLGRPKSEVCLKHAKARLRTRKVPREVPGGNTHPYTTPPSRCLERTQATPITVHQPRLDAATGRSPGCWHQVRDFSTPGSPTTPGAVLQPSGSAVQLGTWNRPAHLPRDPEARVPEHLCLQQDRD